MDLDPFAQEARRDTPSTNAADTPPREPRIVDWLERVRGEYLEMPGLSLTQEQAQRMWGLDPTLCRALFEALSQVGFLHRTNGGAYVRGGRAS